MKRRLIVLVTFLAGLYYVLEFLVPAQFGGALDGSGAESFCVLDLPEATITAYTGIRKDEAPRILAAAELGGGEPRLLLAPSFTRKRDYRGCRDPQYVRQDGRLYYVGLGWDDRTPRICSASLRDGRFQPDDVVVIDKGAPSTWNASGASWVSVVPPDPDRPRTLWFIGRQGPVGMVGRANLVNGQWIPEPRPVLAPPRDGSLESVSTCRALGTEWLLVVSGLNGAEKSLQMVEMKNGAPVGPLQAIPGVGTGLLNARFSIWQTSSGVLPIVFITRKRADGRTQVDALRLADPLHVAGAPALFRAPGRAPHTTYLSDARTVIDDMLVVIGAFAVGLGLIGLAQLHGKRVLQRRKGMPESLAFFAAAGGMTTITLAWRLQHHWEPAYNLMFYGLLQPLGSSMFSLLAVYLVSAAYRAFRIRSLEGALMASSALLIMLGQVPVGYCISSWLPPGAQIPSIMAWLLFVGNNAVVRAVNFGLFVGAIATALRIWLSMDQASMRSME